MLLVFKVTPFRLLLILLVLATTAGLSGATAQEASPTATPTATPTPSPTPPADVLAFEIYPQGKILGDYFQPTIDPGDTAELIVALANTGTVPFEGRTYATNAFTGLNGGFDVAQAGVVPTGVTTWLDYPEAVYTIEPGTALERPFTITVPENTEPGQYITALILENAEAQTIEGSSNFDQVVRFAVPVFITVPGPVEPAFEVGDVGITTDASVSVLDIAIVNTGNILVRPAGELTVSDNAGTELFNAPVTMGSVYARESTTLQVVLPQPLGAGGYTIRVDLSDPETKVTASKEVTITITEQATPVPSPIRFVEASATPRPDNENIQFLEVLATLDNSGEPLTNIQVVLHVTQDGSPVEDFALASSLALPFGQTPIQSRYVPATGWSTGTWQFALTVEAVDPANGVSQLLASVELQDVVIP
jgi:hypothetical protein